MTADFPLTINPEHDIDHAIAELILVAVREGLVLSAAFVAGAVLLSEPQPSQPEQLIDLGLGGIDRDLKADLIAAETAHKAQDYLSAIDLFDRVILTTQTSQSLEIQALANELAANCCLAWGKEKFATVYLQAADHCYRQWGSIASADRLAAEYPHLLPPSHPLDYGYFNDEFIATLSYEFRTPLNSIVGMSEVLLEEVFGVLNAEQLNAITTIDRSSGYLLALIDNTIDLCKIQAGSLELEISDVPIVELCHSSLSFVKPYAIQKQVQLEIDGHALSGNIAVDRHRMRQALINLLNRSIDLTPPGGRTILGVSREHNDGDTWIKFSVTDTSKQIVTTGDLQSSSSSRSSDKRRKDRYNSIGLGLMLVKPIVEMHGGVLSFQSKIGRGNCASISLPDLNAVDGDTATQIHSLEDLAALSELTIEDTVALPLILIADDNELNVDTVSSYLNAKGYRTIWAYNGYEAIDLTKSERPDLILMDIQMPGLDGLAAMSQIRQDPNFGNVPIVALTALAMSGDREQCLAAGANDYLSKPIKLKQLVTIIQQLLSPI